MTHDPREALREERIKEIDRELSALTASPGEQEPCGWQFCCPDGKWIGCDEPPANELRDEPEKFRRVYLSPPPAAGWNEAIQAAINVVKPWPGAEGLAQSEPEKAVENIRREFVKALEALRRAAPAPEGVDRPDAGGSDPTAERREIVARALMDKWPGDYAWGDDRPEPNPLAFETAETILAALDGGAGA